MSEQDKIDAANEAAALDSTKMLERVRKLLALADHENTGKEEAASFREKAEILMQKYRIAEEAAYADRPAADHIQPTSLQVRVCSQSSKYDGEYMAMMQAIAAHVGARVRFERTYGQTWDLVANLVGFETDLKFAEMLYISAQLVFATNMEPVWDDTRSQADNIFYLRQSGMTRADITVKIYGQEHRNSVAKAQKIQKTYLAECERRGVVSVSGRDVSRADFVKVYVATFLQEFRYRLMVARNAADGIVGDSGMVLANRDKRVQEAFWAKYPHLRPRADVGTTAEYVDTRTERQKAADERRWARQDEKEQQERYRLSNSAGGRAGRKAGKSAAQQINLAGVQGTKRVSE